MKKRILFPTDFSDTARNAFEYAIELARRLDATIDLMSIYHLPVADASSVPPDQIDQMLHEKKQQVANHMAEFLKGPNQEYIGKTRIDYGVFVSAEITEAAYDEKYDLIVMGMKGIHNRMEKLMGSTTSHTMMHAPCPVLAVPEDVVFEKLDRIAYATDFYSGESKAIDNLKTLADQLNANITMVHVTRDEVEPGGEVTFDEGHREKNGFTVVSNPSIEDGLNDYIKENDIDILALFIPKRRLWERIFHSSFSKRMAMNTKVPLLTFR